MSIMLPSAPGIQVAKPRLIDFGTTLTPPMGGVAQRLNRPGNRFGIDVTLPSASSTAEGRIYVSRLIQGMTQGVVLAFPQDTPPGVPGAPVVDGPGQSGMVLNIRNFTPNYAAREGLFFSILHGDRRYLHMVSGQIIADGNGKAAVPIFPQLRIQPADGDVCEFGLPMIEGFLSGNAVEWQLQTAPWLDITFTITEAA